MSIYPDSVRIPSAVAGASVRRRTLLRRAAAAGLLAGPAAGLLSACAGSDPGTGTETGTKSADNPFGVADDSSVDVVVFNGGLGDEYPEFDKTLFVAKHDSVTVNLSSTQKIKTEQQPKFSTTPADLINNSGADLMAIDTLINEGALTELTPLLDAPSWDDPAVKVRDTLLPGTVDDGTFDGEFFQLNYAYTVFGLWFDQALFDRNGWAVPTSFDEFFTLAPKIKAAGVAPFAFAGKYPYYMRWPIMTWIWLAGGRQAVVDIDNLTEGAWQTDAVTAAMSAVEKMVADGYTLTGSDTLTHTESQQAWLDGKAAFLPCGTWLENEMRATIPSGFQMKIAPVWSVGADDAAPYGTVQAGSGEGWIVPKKAANAPGGMEFLRAMLSKEGAGKFAELTSSLASVKGSGDNVTTSTALTSANELMSNAPGDLVSFRHPDWYADLDKVEQNAIGELMAGRMTAKEFQDTLQQAADEIAADDAVNKFTRS
ncbi:N-acetylglucosamine/diacetylchitobiose ABC transporter substrate-binding protein [Solwaraspora sp. WMMA2080]|uniref:N-acetylglucosamine/diacetylchitobiose ABC transporter substrate-binding protein n=1 Tax=unclassified Solwaraspora TaxID=2627926 RepID=UPI00248CBF04|nr:MULTISPECIES: N-acetylglucosamine/diacetylchitobiose ABC transporter substrate-binding protein [unclassified Solwaraspora]WBC00033.1 N-acetylglucosamine/diacetylchitobiose ABC transporter substrate-binding protein [Solwaraspora sp. WMMA2059]WBC21421.1 N-acetylglucosamine/diacetylchitobiose ABC transporter substrate-binding protein [Solwaraspora sp. WMMA2080]